MIGSEAYAALAVTGVEGRASVCSRHPQATPTPSPFSPSARDLHSTQSLSTQLPRHRLTLTLSYSPSPLTLYHSHNLLYSSFTHLWLARSEWALLRTRVWRGIFKSAVLRDCARIREQPQLLRSKLPLLSQYFLRTSCLLWRSGFHHQHGGQATG